MTTRLLDAINSPKDIKKLDLKQLEALSGEIRQFLIDSISKTGGHLASNLGVVELTLAIHYCFSIPKDKLIWDVGHQSYVHKILTGRKDRFDTLRKLDGISGFPKSAESRYDCFDTGHSSTSISAALGFAASRDLKGEKYHVLSVIGDGSMTGGLAFEAINNAGRSETNLIVILNDNEMSISKNVGAVSRHLNTIRTAPSYLGAKKDVSNFLGKFAVGKKIGRFIERTKDSIKYFFISGVLFEELGFKYLGPIDGHNMSELIYALNSARKLGGPVLIHTYTKKGKGYAYAEDSPVHFHGVDTFNVNTGKNINGSAHNTYSEIFGETLTKLASENKNIVAVTAAMPTGTCLSSFQQQYPSRFFDVGIAEGHAVTFSAGMAKNGLIPVFAVYSTFLQRSYDQIVHDVCMQKLPVIFAVDRAGIVGADGETHQGVFDLSFLSHIPNMTVMSPRNGAELEAMLEFAVGLGSPAAIRYPRAADNDILECIPPISLGKSEVLFEGEETAIISLGTMIEPCYEAYIRLRELGHKPALINARFVKPLDMEMIQGLGKFKNVFIAEDNIRKGGFGSSIVNALAEIGLHTNVHLLAFPDEFIPQGTKQELFKIYGLDAEGILNTVLSKTSAR